MAAAATPTDRMIVRVEADAGGPGRAPTGGSSTGVADVGDRGGLIVDPYSSADVGRAAHVIRWWRRQGLLDETRRVK